MINNIYKKDFRDSYKWNNKSLTYIKLFRYSFHLLRLIFFLIFFSFMFWIYSSKNDFPINYKGILLILLSILILYIVIKISIVILFIEITPYKYKHDFLLSLYYPNIKKRWLKNIFIIKILKCNIVNSNYFMAKEALSEVDNKRLKGYKLKNYYLLCIIVNLLNKNDKDTRKFCEAYTTFPDVKGLPNNNEIVHFFNKYNDESIIKDYVNKIYIYKIRTIFTSFLYIITSIQYIIYIVSTKFLNNGWHIRINFEELMVFIIFILSLLCLYIFIRSFVKYLIEKIIKKFYHKIILYILSTLFTMFFSLHIFLFAFSVIISNSDLKENEIQENITIENSDKRYNYIIIEDNYSGEKEYYITSNPFFMKEYSDDKLNKEYELKLKLEEKISEKQSENLYDSEIKEHNKNDNEIKEHNGNDDKINEYNRDNDKEAEMYKKIENIFQKIYKSIEDEKSLKGMKIGYNAKGNIYATLLAYSEEVVTEKDDYEIRLYYNDIKDSKHEVVLEKVYLNSSKDTEILGFYTVDVNTGEITYDNRKTW